MNAIEASILLEEAIDIAAKSASLDAPEIYDHLLAFRDGWFRRQRIGSERREKNRAHVPGKPLPKRIGTYTLGPLTINGVEYPAVITEENGMFKATVENAPYVGGSFAWAEGYSEP